MSNHRGALSYDLMTRTPYTIDDVPERMSWVDLLDFVQHVPQDSALAREMFPEQVIYGNEMFTQAILMDIHDAIVDFAYIYASIHAKKGARIKPPKPYKRPWAPDTDDEGKRIGSDPIPADQFDDWWESKDKNQ